MSKAPSIPRVPYHRYLMDHHGEDAARVALIHRDRRITYGTLFERSRRLASAFQEVGLEAGDRVAVAMRTRPAWATVLLACSLTGTIMTPVNPSLSARGLHHQLEETGARAALFDDSSRGRIHEVRGDLDALEWLIARRTKRDRELDLEDLIEAANPGGVTPPSLDPEEDLLALPFSSGTTGSPKGVMLTHTNLLASQLQYVRSGRVERTDVSLLFLPVAHSYGLLLLGGGLVAGATVVTMEAFRARRALAAVERHDVTLFYAIPSVVRLLAEHPDLDRYDFSSVRYVNSGGAPLPRPPAKRLESRTETPVVGGYGLTEAPISGSRVPGEERRIVDLESGSTELPSGEVGEIVIRGPHVMKGYWRDPERTRKVLRDGWLYTGDIGYLDEDGGLHILDRKKDMIKHKGHAVAPAELENVLLEHPAVEDCAVVGRPDDRTGEHPVAFVVPSEEGVRPDPLLEHVSERVADYKRVREIILTDALPRNDFGKVLKEELRDRLEGPPVS